MLVRGSIGLALLMFVCGCGPDLSHLPATVPAEGIVKVDGSPVEGATVTFISETTSYHATGKFSLNAFTEKKGAVPGKYKVEINKTVISGKSAENSEGGDGATTSVTYGLPKKYASIGSSGLTGEVPEKGTTELSFDLSSK
jgi:hypothetical protein